MRANLRERVAAAERSVAELQNVLYGSAPPTLDSNGAFTPEARLEVAPLTPQCLSGEPCPLAVLPVTLTPGGNADVAESETEATQAPLPLQLARRSIQLQIEASRNVLRAAGETCDSQLGAGSVGACTATETIAAAADAMQAGAGGGVILSAPPGARRCRCEGGWLQRSQVHVKAVWCGACGRERRRNHRIWACTECRQRLCPECKEKQPLFEDRVRQVSG